MQNSLSGFQQDLLRMDSYEERLASLRTEFSKYTRRFTRVEKDLKQKVEEDQKIVKDFNETYQLMLKQVKKQRHGKSPNSSSEIK